MSLPPAGRYLQLLRIWRHAWRSVLLILLITSMLDHAGAFGYQGDDWQRFDRQSVSVRQVIDDETVDCSTAVVRLLGVCLNPERPGLSPMNSLAGKRVFLKLDEPQTRDSAGRLLAYVYLSPTDCWNVDLVRAGICSVDTLNTCSMTPQLLAAQSLHRKAISRTGRPAAHGRLASPAR